MQSPSGYPCRPIWLEKVEGWSLGDEGDYCGEKLDRERGQCHSSSLQLLPSPIK